MRTVTRVGRRDLPDLRGSDLRNSSNDIVGSPKDEIDHLGVEEFATHQLSLDEAPQAHAPLRNCRIGMAEAVLST